MAGWSLAVYALGTLNPVRVACLPRVADAWSGVAGEAERSGGCPTTVHSGLPISSNTAAQPQMDQGRQAVNNESQGIIDR